MKPRFIIIKSKDIVYVIMVTAAAIISIIYLFDMISNIFG